MSEYEDIIEQHFTTDVNTNMGQTLEEGKLTVELVPNGAKIRVTDLNKRDCVIKKQWYIGYSCVSEQLGAIVEGFQTIIKDDWIRVFNTDELEFAICGQ